MAQSVIRTPPGTAQALQANGRPLSAAHEQIVSILRGRLGQNHSSLLATPQAEPDGGTTWRTALAGTVLRAAELPDDERLKLQQRADRMLADVRGLAAQLRAEGPAAQMVAQILDAAAQTPPGDWLYSVDGKPVLAMWGHAAIGSVVAPPAPLPPMGATASPVDAASPVPTPARPTSPPPVTPTPPATESAAHAPRRRRLLWAALALLLLVPLLGLLWWLFARVDSPGADRALAEQLAQAEANNRQLEADLARKRAQAPTMQCVPDPIGLLEQRIAAAGENCEALAKLLEAEPLLQGQDADAGRLRQRITDTRDRHCKEAPVREAKTNCPGERSPQQAPEFVMVFDASPSMAYSLNASPAEIALAERQQDAAVAAQALAILLGQPRGALPLDRVTGEPQRMTPARQAAVSVANAIPKDVSTGLVMVDSCAQGARSMGMFAPARRSALLSELRGVRTATLSKDSGTPLADGLAKAGRLVDGVSRDATLLVISDGEESCRGDPCRTAAALAQAKPRLKINVVDITGTGAANCAAAATGGKVFTARNATEVATMMQRAAQDAMAPAECKR